MICIAAVAHGAAEDQEGRGSVIEMTLPEAIALALRSNIGIQSAYMDRAIQRFDLKVAEYEFIPKLDVTGRAGIFQGERTLIYDNGSIRSVDRDRSGDVSAILRERIPTGADFSFTWSRAYDRLDGRVGEEDSLERSLDDTWTFSAVQPLLRGAGIEVNTANLRISRLAEQSNIWSLKSQVIGVITRVIGAYRSFLQAEKQVEISKASLERARSLLDINRMLIESGRMASMEIVQTQADVANREYSYQTSLNSLNNARLAFLNLLALDTHIQVRPIETIRIDPMAPDPEQCVALALQNQPRYLIEMLAMKALELGLVVARNNRLPDLSFFFDYSRGDLHNRFNPDSRSDEWAVGLSLSFPVFGDLSREQGHLSSKTRVEKQKLQLLQAELDIRTAVLGKVRDIKTALLQVRLSEQARKLAAQKLQIEQDKLALGRSTNFQVVSFQNDLVAAEQNELDSKIAYLNALTALDETLGTTLDTWKIQFKSDDPETEERLAD